MQLWLLLQNLQASITGLCCSSRHQTAATVRRNLRPPCTCFAASSPPQKCAAAIHLLPGQPCGRPAGDRSSLCRVVSGAAWLAGKLRARSQSHVMPAQHVSEGQVAIAAWPPPALPLQLTAVALACHPLPPDLRASLLLNVRRLARLCMQQPWQKPFDVLLMLICRAGSGREARACSSHGGRPTGAGDVSVLWARQRGSVPASLTAEAAAALRSWPADGLLLGAHQGQGQL